MADNQLTTVGNFLGLAEVDIARGFLGEAGIDSVIIDDNMGRMLGWNVVGGFKLQVKRGDADRARALLIAPQPMQIGRSGAQLPCCPNCDSCEIAMQEKYIPADNNSVMGAVEIDLHKRRWTCKSCGYCWEMPERPQA